MRWEPLLLIALTACLSGLLIIMTGKKFHWLALVILGYFTGLATILIYTRLCVRYRSICDAPWRWSRQLNAAEHLELGILRKHHSNGANRLTIKMVLAQAIATDNWWSRSPSR
ncbi:hypothetical protein LBR02_13920 [Levilactobacillus brevis]|nr:hypothetical protein LBR02_13920 [Levilactobacillus brevis]